MCMRQIVQRCRQNEDNTTFTTEVQFNVACLTRISGKVVHHRSYKDWIENSTKMTGHDTKHFCLKTTKKATARFSAAF